MIFSTAFKDQVSIVSTDNVQDLISATNKYTLIQKKQLKEKRGQIEIFISKVQ